MVAKRVGLPNKDEDPITFEQVCEEIVDALKKAGGELIAKIHNDISQRSVTFDDRSEPGEEMLWLDEENEPTSLADIARNIREALDVSDGAGVVAVHNRVCGGKLAYLKGSFNLFIRESEKPNRGREPELFDGCGEDIPESVMRKIPATHRESFAKLVDLQRRDIWDLINGGDGVRLSKSEKEDLAALTGELGSGLSKLARRVGQEMADEIESSCLDGTLREQCGCEQHPDGPGR